MDSASLMSIRVIPKSVKEETGHHALERLHHTPYRDEVRLFSCLQRGDLKKLIYELGQIGIQNITVGQMSENDLQQQKYMAVSFITLATRYAIQGVWAKATPMRIRTILFAALTRPAPSAPCTLPLWTAPLN